MRGFEIHRRTSGEFIVVVKKTEESTPTHISRNDFNKRFGLRPSSVSTGYKYVHIDINSGQVHTSTLRIAEMRLGVSLKIIE